MSVISYQSLNAFYGSNQIIKNISFDIPKNQIVALIGPSGCGKSTLLRSTNRLHEETQTGYNTGKILFNGEDIFSAKMNPVYIRQKMGMVFQKPSAFAGLSIWENAVAGRLLQGEKRKSLHDVAEKVLRQAGLWNEVKDKLNTPGIGLSGGQQQRLCIARSLAVDPSVLLMDEPTSALDPISTAHIEELIGGLKKIVTVVIVTHNLQQAARISDQTAFMNHGELIEIDETNKIFTAPGNKLTEKYITGEH